MNKKLVKRVAVASLAALMTIPNLNVPINNTNTVYAAVTDPSLLKSIKKCQDLIEKYKAEGNEVGVKTWTKNLENTIRNAEESQKIIDESNRRKAASEQRQAEANAKQAEAERIANKVYPLEYNGKPVYYTKDFIEYVKNTPELNDFKPHWYEAADMPGLKFQIVLDEYGHVQNTNCNLSAEYLPDGEYIDRFNGSERQIIHKTQVVKIKYISPFETMGTLPYGSGNWAVDHNAIRRSGAGGDGYIARGLNTYIARRDLEWRYGDGWPEGYKGIILGSEQDPNPNWRGNLRVFPRATFISQGNAAGFNTHTKEGGRDVDFSRAFGKEFEIIYDGVFDRYDINNNIADEYK